MIFRRLPSTSLAANQQARLHSTQRIKKRGFFRHELGMEWYQSKEALLQAGQGPVLVGTSYEYISRGGSSGSQTVQQARKYSAFASHWDYWDRISEHKQLKRLHNLHEIFPAETPRCLYFDLDGVTSYRDSHAEIISWLRLYVRWFFSGDRLDWAPNDPEPVVLTSSDPRKYSCHVVFPQIQFKNYAQQKEYMAVLLNGLPALQVDLKSGESLPILDQVVDRVPYSKFQLLRGPYACKLKDGLLHADTCLEPEGVFRSDPLAYFAGNVDQAYQLKLPSVSELLGWNEELRHFQEEQAQRVQRVDGYGPHGICVQDMTDLYHPAYQVNRGGGGLLDLAGLTDLERYEVMLPMLHPTRSTQYWSWFRISGVAFSMLEQYQHDNLAQQRIWKAHLTWSSGYADFDEDENVETVSKAAGARVSGLGLLHRLVKFDNPDLQVRTSASRIHT